MKLKFIKKLYANKDETGETVVLVENSKKEVLGYISYYRNWKCWIWQQERNIIMSSDCLDQVVNKLKGFDNKC